MTMYQCRLRHGKEETVAWIEAKAAQVGIIVRLETLDKQLWRVIEVYRPGLSREALQTKMALDRNSLPSIEFPGV